MATRKIIDLEAEIGKILSEYQDDIEENMAEAVRETAKVGRRKVRENAKNKFGGTGQYAKSWQYQMDTKHGEAKATIYSSIPGLPHLLEYGHAMRNGGRVPGRAHIKPVEDAIAETFTQEIKQRLS